MNPIDEIQNGIINGNWVEVCRGFENLTGKVICTKGISLSSNKLIEQIEKLINEYKKTEAVSIVLNIPVRNDPEPKDSRSQPPPPPSLSPHETITIIKKGHYGNETKLLTEDVPEEEINKNIEKAAITKERKVKRNPPKKYNVQCSQCEQCFESDRQDSKDFGQKCFKCLRDTIDGKISNG